MKNWDKDTPYEKGDSVLYEGKAYTALSSSWGQLPTGKAWKEQGKVLGKITTTKNDVSLSAKEFDIQTPYSTDDIVKYNGILYKAISSSWGQLPTGKAWTPVVGQIKPTKIKVTKTEDIITKAIDANVIIIEQHGFDGKDGKPGPKGDKGDPGKDGKDGQDGLSIKGDKGEPGKDGSDGKSLEFKFEGSHLLVRKEDSLDWTKSIDLKGPAGDSGGSGFSLVGGSNFRLSSHSTGVSLIKNSRGSAATLKTLVAGSNVSLTDNGSTITIAASGGGGGGLSDGDYGDIVVSGLATVFTIDSQAVSLAKMANVATGTVFYRKTAGTGSPEVQTLATLKTDLGLTGTNTGDQTITLTGDVTGSGTGSFATTIGTGKVTNSMLAGSIAASKLIGTDIATVGTITSGTWTGTTIAVANGGTGATDAGTARTNLAVGEASGWAKLTVGTSAPASPSTGDLWVDTN